MNKIYQLLKINRSIYYISAYKKATGIHDKDHESSDVRGVGSLALELREAHSFSLEYGISPNELFLHLGSPSTNIDISRHS